MSATGSTSGGRPDPDYSDVDPAILATFAPGYTGPGSAGYRYEELAPSETRAEVPVLSRALGAVGLVLFVGGLVSVVSAVRGNSPLFGEGLGYLMTVAGLAMLFVHAVRDADPEIRRLYGVLGAVFLLAGTVVSLVPSAPTPGAEKRFAELFLPYGAILGLLGLVFAIPFARNESDPDYRRVLESVLLWAGGSFVVSTLVAGILRPEFLEGPGIVLGLLGAAYLAVYLSLADPAVGLGRTVVTTLGMLGIAALAVGVIRSTVPQALYEGPQAVRTPGQALDTWKALFRGLGVLSGVGVASIGLARKLPLWLRTMALIFGLALAGGLLVGGAQKVLTSPPQPFLVPYGLILIGVGLAWSAVSAAVGSEFQLAVLTRRELTSYFYSPIAYLVLFGMAAVGWLGYFIFAAGLQRATVTGGPFPEPIVAGYMNFGILGAFLSAFLVPAITMRLFAEEKRAGTYEVLLTAPVEEWTVVLSKFLAGWLFFLICWLPAGLYLVALRVGGGAPFDYRPVLSFYLALAASGAAFVAIGTFISSLTRDQLVSAVITFAAMMALLLFYVVGNRQFGVLGPGVQAVLNQLDFLSLWENATKGQLSVQSLVAWASLAVLFLFLTVKSLEVRKWS